MSEIKELRKESEVGEISVEGVITKSYHFFITNFADFKRLIIRPFLFWVITQLVIDVLYYEFNIKIDANIPLALITASFALVWYRQFLLGTDHATYEKLFEHVFSRRNFSHRRLIGSIGRIIIISIVIFVPTLLISSGFMIYQMSQGIMLNDAAIESVAINTTTAVILLFSPIMVRLSQYTVAMSLGRYSLSMGDVWKRTAGNTWILWLLIFRAFLPISLYTYFLKWGLGQVSEKLDIHYIGKSLFINIPSSLLTFMVLAIVVAANAEAFRKIFGVRSNQRD